MSDLTPQPAVPTTRLRRRLSRSPKTIYIALAVLFFCIAAIASVPTLRGEKLRLILLRNQIETSAAPGEPVLIDDWLLNRTLRWKGSPALQHQLLYVRDGQIPASLQASQEEMIVVAPADDPMLASLRSHGFTLSSNASQCAWADAGKGFHTPGHSVLRIYFAMHMTTNSVKQDVAP